MTVLPPSRAGDLARTYPTVWNAYASLGQAAAEAGPLDNRTRRLIKLALAIGARSEGRPTPTRAKGSKKAWRRKSCVKSPCWP